MYNQHLRTTEMPQLFLMSALFIEPNGIFLFGFKNARLIEWLESRS